MTTVKMNMMIMEVLLQAMAFLMLGDDDQKAHNKTLFTFMGMILMLFTVMEVILMMML